MSLKLKYDLQGKKILDESNGHDSTSENIVLHETECNVRNICFIQCDGKRIFLNYAYLISGDYFPDENKIILTFTTHTITLKGQLLNFLFEGFINQKFQQITSIDLRYALVGKIEESFVTEIHIKQH